MVKHRKLKRRKQEGLGMATQIAATPILRGEQAMKVLEEIKKVRSEQAKENAKKLAEYFSKIEQKN